jgi:predicted extracellular nuclease
VCAFNSEIPMSVRIATFNVENLMNRFDFSGFQNGYNRDRAIDLFEVTDQQQYRMLEEARMIGTTDDARQLTALAIADTKADIICLQEVDNIAVLNAFEHGYLFKLIDNGYARKYLIEGNDTRGIDVAVMMRDFTRDGERIEFVAIKSHAALTFAELKLHNPALEAIGIQANEKIFRRDCLELDLTVGGRPLTLFVSHFKSKGGARVGPDGRGDTLPVRVAEAKAVRHVIGEKFGKEAMASRDWLFCGDLNDFYEKLVITDDGNDNCTFTPAPEPDNAVSVLMQGGFCENLVARREADNRWTNYHTRGPQERQLTQIDYLMASPSLARKNLGVKPDIIRKGQPYRTIFPKGQEVDRYPRVGWDRPKASDHCPVAMTFGLG